MTDKEILAMYAMKGYELGLSHGFTVGRGKPPTGEDTRRLNQLKEVTKTSLEEAIQAHLEANAERTTNE